MLGSGTCRRGLAECHWRTRWTWLIFVSFPGIRVNVASVSVERWRTSVYLEDRILWAIQVTRFNWIWVPLANRLHFVCCFSLAMGISDSEISCVRRVIVTVLYLLFHTALFNRMQCIMMYRFRLLSSLESCPWDLFRISTVQLISTPPFSIRCNVYYVPP